MAHLDWYSVGFGWYDKEQKELKVVPFTMSYYKDLLKDSSRFKIDSAIWYPASSAEFTLPKELFQ